MTYNKTKRCRSNCGKTKSGRKKRSTSKKMSKTKKGGQPDENLSEKFANLKADGVIMIMSITSIEKLDMLDNNMKTQPELYKIFKDLIEVHRQTLQK